MLFVGGQRAIRRLLRQLDAAGSSDGQEVSLRALAVLICAELEAFLRGLMQAHIDATASDWEGMLPAQQTLVAAQIVFELSPLVEAGEDEARDPKHAERVARAIRRAASWLELPGQFARDGVDPRLGNFHDPSNVAKAADRLLLLLRVDGMRFFDWLGSHGVDQRSYQLSLETLVALRNDVSHQLRLGLRPTVADLIEHQKRLALLVRMISAYTDGEPRGTGRAAKP